MHHAEFVHLHVHSEYSLLDGAAQLDGLVKKAKDLKFPAIALTDHGNLFGAIDFYLAAQKAGIKPILGAELYVAPGARGERAPQDGTYEGANHLTVLVRDLTGYKNLIKLVSKAYLEGYYYKPRVDRELLQRHAEGLLVLSGCLNSEVSRAISAGEIVRARNATPASRGSMKSSCSGRSQAQSMMRGNSGRGSRCGLYAAASNASVKAAPKAMRMIPHLP